MKRMILHLLLTFQLVISFSSCANQNQKKTDAKIEIDSLKYNSELDTIKEREAASAILDFYKAYSTASTAAVEDSLISKYLTKGLIERVNRITMSTNASPIIRAQDISENMTRTLSVNHLSDNWYMLNYKGDKTIHIPIRASFINGQYMIDYITPSWNDSLYGDSLLCEHPSYPIIDKSNPLTFLQTFYAVYTLKYANMPENLTTQLEKLRTQHLTSNALSQFKSASKEQVMDGMIGYDLLIDDFDFDNLWRSSMKVTPLNDETFQLSYTKWKTMHPAITIKLVKQGKEYFIDSITKK